jgi:hypothetical protein
MRSVLRVIEVFGKRPRVTSLADRLKETPIEHLEREVARSLREESFDDMRLALIELLKVAPLEHFPVLRIVFMKHFTH